MKTTLLTIMAIAALVFAGIGSASAEQWFVVQNSSGFMTVTNYEPGFNWNVVSGPYATWDEAARAGSIDPSSHLNYQIMPVDPIRSFD